MHVHCVSEKVRAPKTRRSDFVKPNMQI